MNNKGQSLVLFVLIIPIVIIILSLVYDVGNMILLRNSLDNLNVMVINYGLDKNIDNNSVDLLNQMIKKNNDNVKYLVYFNDNSLCINLEDNSKMIFGIIDDVKIKSNYCGYINTDGKKIIGRD